jgi:hypothetical protein
MNLVRFPTVRERVTHPFAIEINGLPLHALVVHAAVVFGPLAALTGAVYAIVPPWRDRLRWPLVVVAAIAVGAIWVAYLSGQDLINANQYGGPLQDLVQTHEDRAQKLRLITSAFAIIAWVTAWWHSRRGPVGIVLAALLGLSAVATGVWVVMTGDAGAQIAWYGING